MIAEFVGGSELRVELQNDGMWRLLSPLVFRSKVLDCVVYAPLDFLTDFASVPRVPVFFLLAANRCYKAAVLHDRALEIMPRDQAAELFLEVMEVEGVPEGLRQLMYAGVRLYDQSYRPAPPPPSSD